MQRPHLTFIVGPTASGKTALAIEEAERRGAVILSCDSLCVYRGMDIGTAKPTLAEQARVPHLGLDLADPWDNFSVARYISYRDTVLEAHRESGVPVIVAGGSGFYLKSFFAQVTDELLIPEAVSQTVRQIRDREGAEGLAAALRAHNGPDEAFPGLDWANPRRVEKALLRCLASGEGYSELLRRFAAQAEPLADWDKEVWMIARPTEELKERNARRVQQMLESGLIDEVRGLREKGFERNPSACGAIGYREVLAYLDGQGTLDTLRQAIITHTSQLMRKQRTWFRRQIPVHRELPPGRGGGAD